MLPKSLFLIVAILGLNQPIGSQAQARNNTSKPNSPIAQPGDIFLGDWQWSDGGAVFHITLERNPNWPVPSSPTNQTANVIVGAFSYTRNGTMVAQSAPVTISGVDGLFFAAVQTRKMVMKLYDYSHKKSGQVVLQFPVSSSDDEITWKLYQIEESHYNNPAPPNFSVPTDVTLTRQ